MRCSSCKKEIKDGSKKCAYCGAMIASHDLQNTVQEGKPETVDRQPPAAQQSWWKYSVFADKSISRLDQILFFVYIGFAFYNPITALLSLASIYVIRRNDVNAVYTKSATVIIIFVAAFKILIYIYKTYL
jgi:zinc-ribbon domain